MRSQILILAACALCIAILVVRYLRPKQTLEEKLAVLQQCGFTLANPFAVDDLLGFSDRKEFEKPGYALTLSVLGLSEEKEPFRPFCINLWDMDTECIEDTGDYKRIADRLSEMAQGSLPITNVQDYVGTDGKAWLSFDLKGEHVRIDCKVHYDWVDESIFSRFAELLHRSDPNKLYVIYPNQGGQDITIGCVTEDQFSRLKSHRIPLQRLHPAK